MEDNIIGTALMQQQISRYNPITNRCYIKLEVSTADLGTPQERFVRNQYLFDGQTKEMLASASWEGLNKKLPTFSLTTSKASLTILLRMRKWMQ